MKTKHVTCTLGCLVPEKIARNLDALAKQMPKGETPRRKTFTPKSLEVLDGERADVSWVTTKDVDLDREIVDPDGMDLAVYQSNPVVLWDHDPSRPPIARCGWIKRVEDGFKAKTLYAPRPQDHPEQASWFADEIFHLVKSGFLVGKSIGFIPLEIDGPDEVQKSMGCERVIKRSVLFEYSVVSIPCNSLALVEAVSKKPSLMAQLGFKPVKVRKPDPIQRVLKALDSLNPERIAEEAINRIRGRV